MIKFNNSTIPISILDLCLDYLSAKGCCESLFCLDKSWNRVFCLQRSVFFFRKCVEAFEEKILAEDGITLRGISLRKYYNFIREIDENNNDENNKNTVEPVEPVEPLPVVLNVLPRFTIRLLKTIVYAREAQTRHALKKKDDSDSQKKKKKKKKKKENTSNNDDAADKTLSLAYLNDLETTEQALVTVSIYEIVGVTSTNSFTGPDKLVAGKTFFS
jgi:hypothetical protein